MSLPPYLQSLNIYARDRNDLDLSSKEDTYKFFQDNNPDYFKYPGDWGYWHPLDFLNENLLIQLNVLNAAKKFDARKVLFFASSCMYPKNSNNPLKESQIFSGDLRVKPVLLMQLQKTLWNSMVSKFLAVNSSSFILSI